MLNSSFWFNLLGMNLNMGMLLITEKRTNFEMQFCDCLMKLLLGLSLMFYESNLICFPSRLKQIETRIWTKRLIHVWSVCRLSFSGRRIMLLSCCHAGFYSPKLQTIVSILPADKLLELNSTSKRWLVTCQTDQLGKQTKSQKQQVCTANGKWQARRWKTVIQIVKIKLPRPVLLTSSDIHLMEWSSVG